MADACEIEIQPIDEGRVVVAADIVDLIVPQIVAGAQGGQVTLVLYRAWAGVQRDAVLQRVGMTATDRTHQDRAAGTGRRALDRAIEVTIFVDILVHQIDFEIVHRLPGQAAAETGGLVVRMLAVTDALDLVVVIGIVQAGYAEGQLVVDRTAECA